MTHEFKKIVESYLNSQQKNAPLAVLATVVDLNGSSYRKPGVRMLIYENGNMVGAVSGGCVEKAIYKAAIEVFETGLPKMMAYDGRFRLGCEGLLYILIEPFKPDSSFINAFQEALEKRVHLEFVSFYQQKEGLANGLGTLVKFDQNRVFSLTDAKASIADQNEAQLLIFSQQLPPCFKLVIIGGG